MRRYQYRPKDKPKGTIFYQKLQKRNIVFAYTFAFAIMAVWLFGYYFAFSGRSLVSWTDGLRQHCMTLAYVGEWLRTILSNLFVEHTLNIPMFDFSIGLGHDIVSTLHYYGLGDPLNALAVFFPPEYTEHLYGFLLVIRLYLAGLFFALYMNTKVQNPQAVFVGALSYAFTPFALTAVINHPMFAIGLMYFPLVIWGIDRTLEKKSPVLYIVSLALAVLSNFYFAYINIKQ